MVDVHPEDLVWYVSYGSNMAAARFDCYLRGGRPAGASRDYPGCRDRTPPRAVAPVWLPGSIYFALESAVWSGGMAFYDPAGTGRVAARAYLIGHQQFSDVMAQEMHRPPGSVPANLRTAARLELGPGRYETVVPVGERDGHPMLTFTCPAPLEPNPPSAAYLAMMLAGLREAHGPTAVDYLLTIAGIRPTWTRAALEAL